MNVHRPSWVGEEREDDDKDGEDRTS